MTDRMTQANANCAYNTTSFHLDLLIWDLWEFRPEFTFPLGKEYGLVK